VPTVSWLSVAPVKGLALTPRDELALESFGALENRRFHLLDERGRFVNGLTRLERSLFAVVPRWEPHADTLSLTFPDGAVVDGHVELGEPVSTWFYNRDEPGRIVQGPWARALSDYAGRELRLVRTDEPGRAVDRVDGSVSIVSDESVDELARQAGVDVADARRFRMLVGVQGGKPHLEDTWIGRDVRIGEALVRVHEQVARCAITTKNPDSGERDLDTLRVIRRYRGTRGEKQIDFGVYGEVVERGRVHVGDPVEPLATV
jgi:uncharacterized protein YcbX